MGMGSGGSKGGGQQTLAQGLTQFGSPQSGMSGKGGVQPPQGSMSGKGGTQTSSRTSSSTGQNPYAQQYYRPQFQPETFNNPYAQGGFGQQPQMGGYGGKGGGMYQPPQGGMGGKGGQTPPQGGMGGKGGQMGGMDQPQVSPPSDPAGRAAFFERYGTPSTHRAYNPNTQYSNMIPQSGMGGKGGQTPAYMQPYLQQLQQKIQQQPTGLAALQQPTATTQALQPEQPYMGNYLQ